MTSYCGVWCWLYTVFWCLLVLVLVMLWRCQCFWVRINGYVGCSGVLMVVFCVNVWSIRSVIYFLDCRCSNTYSDGHFNFVDVWASSFGCYWGDLVIYIAIWCIEHRLQCWVSVLLSVYYYRWSLFQCRNCDRVYNCYLSRIVLSIGLFRTLQPLLSLLLVLLLTYFEDGFSSLVAELVIGCLRFLI